jgi:maltooligosyltrehalose trehalohydrolase
MREWRYGPRLDADGATFRVWAPAQAQIALAIEGDSERPMVRDDEGIHTLHVPGAHAGQRYWLRLPDGLRPDPASRFQPDGPLGASELIADAFAWTDHGWTGITAPHRHVIYEMHIGTFTGEGTWDAAAARLSALADLGITTLEVMPIAEFGGSFGWGYDGVQLFAPTRLYGRPDAAKRFIDDAHRLGLAVILDVVYNHFGPVGNFMREFSPTFFGSPGEWGDLFNFDGGGASEVRRFVTENAAYWIDEFHFDGLRFDATQAIHDRSPEHIISEICAAARAAAGRRSVFLVGESEPQDTRLLKGHGAYRDGLDALWNEDWHHAAFVRATGRRQAYFTDYQGSAAEFASMARHGTLYQGQWYTWQQNRRGAWAIGLPASAFVTFLENHDQVANTGLGTRLHDQVDRALWRALTSLLVLGPAIPMLFQGQEFGSTRPFAYFADHDGDLAAAVDAGRRQFLTQFPGLAQPAVQERLPRPGDREVFERCRLLDAERIADSPLRRLHRDLIHQRRDDPVLSGLGTASVGVESSAPEPSLLVVRYLADAGHRLLVVNFGDDHDSPMNEPLFAPQPGTDWHVAWSSEDPSYGGGGTLPFVRAGRWRLQARSAVLLASEPLG